MADPTEPDPQALKVLVDEKDHRHGTAASSAVETSPSADTSGPTPTSAATTGSNLSPPASPPASPPSPDARKNSRADEYYAHRPKHDKLGNPIPQRRQPGAMAAVYGSGSIKLPGDLGSKDPRRPKSPVPSQLPGDLGPNDPRRPKSPAPPGHQRHGSAGSDAPAEGERLLKDPKQLPSPDENERGDSDDDADADNDNDTDAEYTGRGRERKRPEPGRTTSGKAVNLRDESEDSERDATKASSRGHKPDPTKGESRISLSGDPTIKITPASEKKRVHPSTAFDAAPSGISTPMTSDDESHSELRAAQKLSLTLTNIHSTPSAYRVIRQIIRGDYSHFQHEAEEGRRRQRMYLVATDSSPESEYALEWTIGTVLRDGDTLFGVYAMDEDESGGASEGGVAIGQGAELVKDTAAIVKGLQNANVPVNAPGPSPLTPRAGILANAENRSRSRGVYSAAETERRRAIEDISQRIIKLLRKTRLQVRVVVEVFHCKSPRHMITEVIDFLSPTLVIIGSRGQSAVKGVLLGSFSNYLVTKSSVPVMVARKKLRKHSKSSVKRNKDGTAVPYSGTSGRPGRFSNMIEVPRAKGLRVKGWEQHFWWWLGPASKALFAGSVKPILSQAYGTVLDIGPASGVWSSDFGEIVKQNPSKITTMYGVEPNTNFHDQLLANAKAAGLGGIYEPVAAYAQNLDKSGIKKGSVDTIITVHVLCSVGSQQAEIIKSLYEYLKPGGQWLVYEHVVSSNAPVRMWQGKDTFTTPWGVSNAHDREGSMTPSGAISLTAVA